MLSNKKLEELEKGLFKFKDRSVSINWFARISESTALMNIEMFDCFKEYKCFYICNDDIAELYIKLNSIVDYTEELDRITIDTEDINYIIETA
jgi:hypothetical protein